MIIDANGEQGDADDPEVTEHSRQGSDDVAEEAGRLLGAIDRAKDGYRDNVKASPAVARSTFAEEAGMGVNALRGKLEDRHEDELAGEMRWDLEADDFDAEVQRVRSVVQRVAEGAADQHEADDDRDDDGAGDAGDEAAAEDGADDAAADDAEDDHAEDGEDSDAGEERAAES